MPVHADSGEMYLSLYGRPKPNPAGRKVKEPPFLVPPAGARGDAARMSRREKRSSASRGGALLLAGRGRPPRAKRDDRLGRANPHQASVTHLSPLR